MAYLDLNNVTLHYPTSGASTNSIGQGDGSAVAGQFVRSARGGMAVQAIDRLTLSLKDGDRLGIIGSNGSGKTTLLQIMAGILSPVGGAVAASGRIATMFSIGLGMQADASGMRNIYLAGLVAGATRQQIKASIPDIEDFTGLGDYLQLPVRTYSHGMAMRLRFACATAFQPDIILLDEWIGAGDAEFQEKARLRLEHLLKRAGIVVIASHNRQLIRRVSNMLLWLERGKVRAHGGVDDVLRAREDFMVAERQAQLTTKSA
ncbi:MAG: ATP-binding cassette domain-containing protein [Pseudomonadota bacterium]